jgi:hypothetical protein
VMKYCTWCDKEFESVSAKQIYCGAECRQEASKQKIVERYEAEKIKKRIGKNRRCAGGCGTLLSIYNEMGICDNCVVHKKKMQSFMREIKEYFDYESK